MGGGVERQVHWTYILAVKTDGDYYRLNLITLAYLMNKLHLPSCYAHLNLDQLANHIAYSMPSVVGQFESIESAINEIIKVEVWLDSFTLSNN